MFNKLPVLMDEFSDYYGGGGDYSQPVTLESLYGVQPPQQEDALAQIYQNSQSYSPPSWQDSEYTNDWGNAGLTPESESWYQKIISAIPGTGPLKAILGGDANAGQWMSGILGGLGAYAQLQQEKANQGNLNDYLNRGNNQYRSAGLTPPNFNVPQAKTLSQIMTNPNRDMNFSTDQWEGFGPQGRANLMNVMGSGQFNAMANKYTNPVDQNALMTYQAIPRLGRLSYYAGGGLVAASPYLRGYVKGGSSGQADNIPARLSDGEYVMDADTVSALGDGNNDAGAEQLDAMREKIRKHKRSAPPDKIPPKAKKPEAYLKG